MAQETGTGNLDKVDHIVVLMLENRSFDHMLGYLSLEGGRNDIDGLRPEFANEHDGHAYPVHHLDCTAIADDPDHSSAAVDLQVGGGGAMDGFAASYAATLASRGIKDGDPGRVLGYYNADDVPVYDHLARQFAVCDRWFSSVPGATWPNRLYAICGRAADSRDDLPMNMPPLYKQPSFVRHLDAHDITWRWYSFEAGTLRMADAHYALGHHDRFAFFSKSGLNWKTALEVRIDTHAASFLEDAARGTLPSVSWIDPNFSNFNPIGFQPNDDHAPADIKDGQELVLAVYHALAAGPQWEKTLLIIFYDEHGGFFDHVTPPAAPDDDPQDFGLYGVRVPALAVSPWIEPGSVSSTVFDHTSIAKTILRRFCPDALIEHKPHHGLFARASAIRRPHYLGTRVAQAHDLGELLTRSAPRPAPDRVLLIDSTLTRAAVRPQDPPPGPDDPGGKPATDLQLRIAAAVRELRRRGHPADRP
ncbi:MAG TPA: alkaline phosphatase family protein [Trebonia sp.]